MNFEKEMVDIMRNKICLLFVFIGLSFSFYGCGSYIPELSEEESALVSEYAAGLLLKYNSNSQSRLVDTSIVPEEELELLNPSVEEETNQESESEANIPEESTSENVIEETPIVEIEVAEVVDIATILGYSDLSIQYMDYSVQRSYPAEGDEDFFLAFDATEGNELVIFRFQLNNVSENQQTVNFLEKNLSTRIILNETETYRTLKTLLLDDFNSYIDEVEPLGIRTLVLLIEVPIEEVEFMESADLQIKIQGNTEKIPLF